MTFAKKPKTEAVAIGIVCFIILMLIQIFFNFVSYTLIAETHEKTEELHSVFFPEDRKVEIEIIEE